MISEEIIKVINDFKPKYQDIIMEYPCSTYFSYIDLPPKFSY